MRHDFTKCEIKLLHEIQKKFLKRTQPAQKEVMEDKGRYRHTISRYLENILQYEGNSHVNAS